MMSWLSVFVLAGLLIAGVAALFVKLRAKAWWIVGPVAGLLLLLLLPMGLYSTHRAKVASEQRAKLLDQQGRLYEARYSRTRTAAGRSDTITIERSGGAPLPAGSSDAASADRLSEMFLADVYPSAIQAAEALAAHVARSFHGSPDQSATPTPPAVPPSPAGFADAVPTRPAGPGEAAALPDVLVTGRADAMILQAVADALRKGAMARRVRISSGDATPPPASRPASSGKEVFCAVSVNGGDSGTVQIVLDVPENEKLNRAFICSARFVSKPWAADFARYAARARGPVVRAGSGAVASFEEAQERAFDDAARQLVPYVNSAIKSMTPPGGMVDARAMHDAILAELRKGKLVLDRFGQQFDRPYGKLWREQILVDASPRVVGPIAGGIAGKAAIGRRAARQTRWTLTVSLGGLAVLIFAVYLVLNAATKGYYTWVLRLLAIGAIIAGVALACIA
jgi:hypothetical protein